MRLLDRRGRRAQTGETSGWVTTRMAKLRDELERLSGYAKNSRRGEQRDR
jgi:hypothetical protein